MAAHHKNHLNLKPILIAVTLGLGLTLAVWLLFSRAGSALARPAQALVLVAPGQSIQAALDGATPGDTVLVQAGLYTESLTLSRAISLTGVSSATTIIQAVTDQRVLTVTGAAISQTVVISGLTLTGGDIAAGNGGAILITGEAQPLVQNVTITNNQASIGGGLYIDTNSRLRLIGGKVISNIAASLGGGGYSRGLEAWVQNSQFKHNRSGNNGGGLRVFNNNLQVVNSHFISNTAAADGGGLAVTGQAVVNGSYFRQNKADGSGGGLTAITAAITGGQFIDNSATDNGGGLYVDTTLDLTGATFISNSASFGGGGLIFGALTIGDAHFEQNSAATSGGAIYAGNQATLTQTGFASNSATFGGGLYVATAGQGLLNQIVFTGNSASFGGGLYANGPAVITGGQFISNNVSDNGGGLRANDTLALTGTQFISNSASLGGGLYADAPLITLSRAYFTGNQADIDGGGLYGNGDLTLTQSDFVSNSAAFGGGALLFGTAHIVEGRFERNVASSSGGGLSGDSLSAFINGTHFLTNTADNGAGLGVAGTVVISEALFSGNRAVLDGGGLNVQNEVWLHNVDFVANEANLGGGASVGTVTFLGNNGQAYITGGRFENNSATRAGGGVAVARTLVSTGTRYIDNFADQGGGGASSGQEAVFVGAYFEGNEATDGGGGLLVSQVFFGSATLTLSDTSFIDNTAELGGGGVLVNGPALVKGGLFAENSCTDQLLDCTGGGLHAVSGVTVTGTRFVDNSGTLGGGLATGNTPLSGGPLVSPSPVRIVNAIFARNQASEGAALRLESDEEGVVLHTSMAAATLQQASAVLVEDGDVTVQNTIVASYATGIRRSGGTAAEDYNLFFNVTNNTAGTVSSGGHSLDGDPHFIDPGSDDYHLGSGSLARNGGVNAKVNVDIDGASRPQGSGFDIGAYEAAPFNNGEEKVYLPVVIKDK